MSKGYTHSQKETDAKALIRQYYAHVVNAVSSFLFLFLHEFILLYIYSWPTKTFTIWEHWKIMFGNTASFRDLLTENITEIFYTQNYYFGI